MSKEEQKLEQVGQKLLGAIISSYDTYGERIWATNYIKLCIGNCLAFEGFDMFKEIKHGLSPIH